jgi:tryptophan synthase alpha chain
MVNQSIENRIDSAFLRLKNNREKALITYVMAGDPNLDMTEKIILALEEGGADLIEIGVPFTDPLADGPVIQKAANRGLASKTTLSGILKMVERLRRSAEADKPFRTSRVVRQKSAVPLILMSYYNPILQYGEEKFAADAVRSGVDGVIIPDLPAGESPSWEASAKKNHLKSIFLLAPTSSKERIKKVAKVSSGFIYYVALTGITGAKLTISREIGKKIKEIKQHAALPVAVGFGISTPDQAHEISKGADGIIVGSAIVKRIEETPSTDLLPPLTAFIKSLKQSLLHK